eukprot:1136489-Lingulodinium_polyedra.AAC.1
MQRHLRGSSLDRPPSWLRLCLTGAPKCPRPESFLQFRWIACTPVVLKWFLRALVALGRQSVGPRHVLTVGFSPGLSTGLVAHSVQECLWLARTWRLPLWIASMDIR